MADLRTDHEVTLTMREVSQDTVDAPWRTLTLATFRETNAEDGFDVYADVCQLGVDEEIMIGGGACPEVIVRRVA
jgi:hypothetical protein